MGCGASSAANVNIPTNLTVDINAANQNVSSPGNKNANGNQATPIKDKNDIFSPKRDLKSPSGKHSDEADEDQLHEAILKDTDKLFSSEKKKPNNLNNTNSMNSPPQQMQSLNFDDQSSDNNDSFNRSGNSFNNSNSMQFNDNNNNNTINFNNNGMSLPPISASGQLPTPRTHLSNHPFQPANVGPFTQPPSLPAVQAPPPQPKKQPLQFSWQQNFDNEKFRRANEGGGSTGPSSSNTSNSSSYPSKTNAYSSSSLTSSSSIAQKENQFGSLNMSINSTMSNKSSTSSSSNPQKKGILSKDDEDLLKDILSSN